MMNADKHRWIACKSKFGMQVAVAPPGVTVLDARLGVPNEQAAGDYSGTVILTFSNSV